MTTTLSPDANWPFPTSSHAERKRMAFELDTLTAAKLLDVRVLSDKEEK